MTLEELIKCCDEAEEAQSKLIERAEAFFSEEAEGYLSNMKIQPCKPAAFNVFVSEIKYGRTVRIAPGLSGKNLGHYPKGTMVSLEVPLVRKWIKSVQEESDRP